MHLLNNTPFEKVSLQTEEFSTEDLETLAEYKKAQQEASALGSSMKMD